MAGLTAQYQQTTFTSPTNGQTGDATVVLGNDNATRAKHNAHDADATIHFQSSTNATRPAAGTLGRKWIDADTYRVYYDDGSAWHEIAYLGSGTAAISGTLTIGSAASFGDVVQASASGANSRVMSYAAAGNPVFVGRRSSGTTSAPTDAPNGGSVVQLIGEAYSGSAWFASGSVQIVVDGTFTAAQAPPSRIDFYTNAANTAPTLALTIKKDQTATFSNTVTVALGGIAVTGNSTMAGTLGGVTQLAVTTSLAIGAAAATTGAIRLQNTDSIYARNAANTTDIPLITLDSVNVLRLGNTAAIADIYWGRALVALGGGSAATLGTVGGAGPASAAQNSWMRVIDSLGAAFWVPAYK